MDQSDHHNGAQLPGHTGTRKTRDWSLPIMGKSHGVELQLTCWEYLAIISLGNTTCSLRSLMKTLSKLEEYVNPEVKNREKFKNKPNHREHTYDKLYRRFYSKSLSNFMGFPYSIHLFYCYKYTCIYNLLAKWIKYFFPLRMAKLIN